MNCKTNPKTAKKISKLMSEIARKVRSGSLKRAEARAQLKRLEKTFEKTLCVKKGSGMGKLFGLGGSEAEHESERRLASMRAEGMEDSVRRLLDKGVCRPDLVSTIAQAWFERGVQAGNGGGGPTRYMHDLVAKYQIKCLGLNDSGGSSLYDAMNGLGALRSRPAKRRPLSMKPKKKKLGKKRASKRSKR